MNMKTKISISLENQNTNIQAEANHEINCQIKLDNLCSKSNIHVMEDNRPVSNKSLSSKKILKIKRKTTDRLKCLGIKELKKCFSKKKLKLILQNLTKQEKNIFKLYLSHCFVIYVVLNKKSKRSLLLSKRDLFFKIIDNPSLLDKNCGFDNNIVRKFCQDSYNFINQHYDNLKRLFDENEQLSS